MLIFAPLHANEMTGSSSTGEQLLTQIERIAGRAHAHIGVSVVHLETGEHTGFNENDEFPLASTYKIAMAGTALALVDRGVLDLDRMIPVPDRIRVVSSVITDSLPHSGVSLSLHNLLDLMLRESDNTATDLLLETIGGAPAVMNWLEFVGVSSLRVDRSTAELLREFAGLPVPAEGVSFVKQAEALQGDPRLESYFTDGSGPRYQAFARDPQDQGTPSAMTTLLTRLWKGELLSPASTRVLKEIMLRCETGPNRIRAGLPENTPVAHKTGTIAGTVNDVGVVTLPDGQGYLVMSVFMMNAMGAREDQERVIEGISRLAYRAYAGEHEQ